MATQPNSSPHIGFVLSQEQSPVPELVEYGAAAERAGFEMVWSSDHFQPWQPNQGHAGHTWVTLAALSQRTSRLCMGTGVTCPIFRYRPAIVAEAFTSLSLLAPGRIFLSLGTGEKLNEGASGGGWALYPERAARLTEAVQIIRRLWSGEHVSFTGQYYQVEGRLYDTPAQPIPIYIAAAGPKSARLAGEYGDGLVADTKALEQQPEYKKAFQEAARAAGKNPETMPILGEHFAVVGDETEARRCAEQWRFHPNSYKPGYFNNISPSDIQRNAERQVPLEEVYKTWTVSTDPTAHLEAIQKLVDLGVTHIFIHSPQQDQVRVAEFYEREVLPRVREGAITGARQVSAA